MRNMLLPLALLLAGQLALAADETIADYVVARLDELLAKVPN